MYMNMCQYSYSYTYMLYMYAQGHSALQYILLEIYFVLHSEHVHVHVQCTL